MQYREVALAIGQLVNASAMTSKTDTNAAAKYTQNPPKATTKVAGVVNLYETEAPRAQNVKFTIYADALVAAGALAAVQVRGLVTADDGTTRDILLGTFAALNAAGQSLTLDIANCPQNVYLAYGTLTGTSITVTCVACLG